MTNSNFRSQVLMEAFEIGVSYKLKRGPFSWKSLWALDDVSFKVYRAETLGVVGRNGAGKTTLLRLLAGIIKPDRGRLTCLPLRASLLSLQAGFLPHLSGRDNAVLSGMMLGVSRKIIKSKMNEIISLTGLGQFIDQPLRTYSTGMRARLGFTVAVISDPDVILIDEVLSVGDIEFQKTSSTIMREKVKSDKTVIVVSHNQNLMRDICDRVVWLENGSVVQEGPALEVLDDYQAHIAQRFQSEQTTIRS